MPASSPPTGRGPRSPPPRPNSWPTFRPHRHPSTVDLDGLGRYRLIALHARGGDETIVTGLPLSDVDDTLLWVLVMFCVVGAIALVAATAAGIVIIRRQLAPLSRVSAAARQVADLELDRGEVRLPTPIVAVDPPARTPRSASSVPH